MTMRTSVANVTFNHAFSLPDMRTPYLPGTYRVETDEETIDSLSFVAYRRVATRIHLSRPGSIEVVTVDPTVLEQMLDQDRSGVSDEYAQRDSIGISSDSET